jgi:hypothetical protein
LAHDVKALAALDLLEKFVEAHSGVEAIDFFRHGPPHCIYFPATGE